VSRHRCDLFLPPDILAFSGATANAAEWIFSIPLSTSLAGSSIYQQAFPLEAGVNPLGITASNGLRMVLGIR
jgi:hypothetical protein